MDEEISFEEFSGFYNQVLKELMEKYQDMSQDDCLKSRFIMSTVAQNAAARGARKGPQVKKYRKIQEKCAFWSDAIQHRLIKEGMSKKDLEEAMAKLGENDSASDAGSAGTDSGASGTEPRASGTESGASE